MSVNFYKNGWNDQAINSQQMILDLVLRIVSYDNVIMQQPSATYEPVCRYSVCWLDWVDYFASNHSFCYQVHVFELFLLNIFYMLEAIQ